MYKALHTDPKSNPEAVELGGQVAGLKSCHRKQLKKKNSCTSLNYTLKYAVKMLRRLTAAKIIFQLLFIMNPIQPCAK